VLLARPTDGHQSAPEGEGGSPNSNSSRKSTHNSTLGWQDKTFSLSPCQSAYLRAPGERSKAYDLRSSLTFNSSACRLASTSIF